MLLKNTALFVILVSIIKTVTSNEAADVATGAAKACYAGFVANIPPSFCFKKGADFGVIPTECSSGYFRSLALCYQNCKSGYYFVAGVCWSHCRSGYTDHGLTCFRHLFDWYFKSSYMSSSYTNFDSRVACKPGMYKAGALCYRDCRNVGLQNCGIGACSATLASCVSTIISMGIDFLMGLAKAVMLVLSFGSSAGAQAGVSAAEVTVKTGFDKLGKFAIKEGLNIFKQVIQTQGKKVFIKQMTEYAVKNIGKFAAKGIANGVVTTVCENMGAALLGKLESANDIKLNFQNFDFTGISNIVMSCKDMKNSNDNLMCAKAVLQSADIVDPTGICAMAAAVMQPVCENI